MARYKRRDQLKSKTYNVWQTSGAYAANRLAAWLAAYGGLEFAKPHFASRHDTLI